MIVFGEACCNEFCLSGACQSVCAAAVANGDGVRALMFGGFRGIVLAGFLVGGFIDVASSAEEAFSFAPVEAALVFCVSVWAGGVAFSGSWPHEVKRKAPQTRRRVARAKSVTRAAGMRAWLWVNPLFTEPPKMQEGVQSASIVAQSSDVCRPWRARGGVKSTTKNRPSVSGRRRGEVMRGKGALGKAPCRTRALFGQGLEVDFHQALNRQDVGAHGAAQRFLGNALIGAMMGRPTSGYSSCGSSGPKLAAHGNSRA